MSFYRSLPDDRPKTWYEEFRAEILSDHRQLLACREARASRGDWSFDQARRRTQNFYRERLNGYHSVGSIDSEQLLVLLGLVDKLGAEDFPEQ